MDKNKVAESLRLLASSKSRSHTARLRDVLDDVENALSAGVGRAAILDTLRKQGLAMNANTFASSLFRLRKQRAVGKGVVGDRPFAAALGNRENSLQVVTPKKEDESEDLVKLTPEEKRAKRASQFIKPEPTNSLLKNLLKDKKQ